MFSKKAKVLLNLKSKLQLEKKYLSIEFRISSFSGQEFPKKSF